MRSPFAICAVATLLAGTLSAAPANAAETLRAGGTGAATELLRQVGAEFTAASGVKIDVIPSLGSSGALRALVDGKLDIAVSARPLKADESAAGLRQVAVFQTAFVLATSHRNPNGLRAVDVPEIFAAEKPTWADGTPIRIILRPRSEADTVLFGTLFDGMDVVIETARRRAEVPTAATDQDNADLAERIPGSLTGTTVVQLVTERRRLQIVPIDGVEPTLANLESGAYRFVKKLYFIAGAKSGPEISRFVEFLRSPPGLKALREAAVLPEIR